MVRDRSVLHPGLAPLPGSADVHQGPGAGGGPHQAGHVPEVRAQEAMVYQGKFMITIIWTTIIQAWTCN